MLPVYCLYFLAVEVWGIPPAIRPTDAGFVIDKREQIRRICSAHGRSNETLQRAPLSSQTHLMV